VNDPHKYLPKKDYRLAWIPKQSETVIRASQRRERQLGVPAGIPIHLTSRLVAPSTNRSLCQPTVASYSTFSFSGVLPKHGIWLAILCITRIEIVLEFYLWVEELFPDFFLDHDLQLFYLLFGLLLQKAIGFHMGVMVTVPLEQ
jgi:hypothetical protein